MLYFAPFDAYKCILMFIANRTQEQSGENAVGTQDCMIRSSVARGLIRFNEKCGSESDGDQLQA